MNRCPRNRLLLPFLAALLAVAAGALSIHSSDVQAQIAPRQFPSAAKRGILQVKAPPDVLLNETNERLSPGARIHGLTNMLVMSGQMVGQRVVVNYTRNPQGLIHEVWILSEAEAQEKRAGLEPVTNFVFGSDAGKPKTDDGKTPFNQLPMYKK